MKKFFRRLRTMSEPAYAILKYCILVSLALVSAALILLLYAGGFNPRTYELYLLIRELYTMPAAILLIASIASVCVEERAIR